MWPYSYIIKERENMKNYLNGFRWAFIMLFICTSSGIGKPINIIPLPNKIETTDGFFKITSKTKILVSTETENEIAEYTQDLFKTAMGYSLSIHKASKDATRSRALSLNITEEKKSLGPEGYELKVSPKSMVIASSTKAGLFYGIQTLRQLLPPEIDKPSRVSRRVKWKVPCVKITDKPQFKWRGMHLDVGRHLFSVDFIKKYLDLIALHKMNTFHWHLTEDQGWRIEIKKYPKLTEIGSKRSATPIPSNRRKLDGKPYGGFYTQKEIKEIVKYAAARFINVVPEIELPGHSVAALASYPHLGCRKIPYKVRTRWGVTKDVYCAGNEEVYTFLENVFQEVLDLFPSEFIHIGGDECPKDRWKACAQCQAKIKEAGLKDEYELQSYFVKRIGKFLSKNKRRFIGWDEILEGGLAPGAIVMSWRGVMGGIKAAKMGHDVVMSPTTHCYFDYYQSKNTNAEPPAIGGFLPLARVYRFNPIPSSIPANKAVHVLGGQGNVWTEYIPDSKQAEYMAFPRASALSEVLWTSRKRRRYAYFQKRLPSLLKRLEFMDVNFRDPQKK